MKVGAHRTLRSIYTVIGSNWSSFGCVTCRRNFVFRPVVWYSGSLGRARILQGTATADVVVQKSLPALVETHWRSTGGSGYDTWSKEFINFLRFVILPIALFSFFGFNEAQCQKKEEEHNELGYDKRKTDKSSKVFDHSKQAVPHQSFIITSSVPEAEMQVKENKSNGYNSWEGKVAKERVSEGVGDERLDDDMELEMYGTDDQHSSLSPKVISTDGRKQFFEPGPDELQKNASLKSAIDSAKVLIFKKMREYGTPGVVIGVSIDGKNVWMTGFGESDVENKVLCTPATVMRVASISKTLTMAAVGKLIDEGKLDIDAPIQKYVPEFPIKKVDGKKVTVTTRHLLNHTSGIRHYKLKEEEEDSGESKKKLKKKKKDADKEENSSMKISEKVNKRREEIRMLLAEKITLETKKKKEPSEFDMGEYYIKERFDTVSEALELFEGDELFFKPGDRFHYTTHGWTLVAAVVEGASEETFRKHITKLFKKLGLQRTYLDEEEPLISWRSKYYQRDTNNRLKNTPYVNNSCKWAGGGILSNVGDLNQFGNAMLYSYQYSEEAHPSKPKGFLSPEVMKLMWSPSTPTKDSDFFYGLGWQVLKSEPHIPYCQRSRFCACHTGAAVGASSVLLILPSEDGEHSENGSTTIDTESNGSKIPKGVVVSIMTNLTGVSLSALAKDISLIFENVRSKENAVGQIAGKPESEVFHL